MIDPAERPELSLMRLLDGYRITQSISVAATLGIADLLATQPRTSDDLAAELGVHADALYRLMRALASLGLLHEEPGRVFQLTELGAVLRTDTPESLRGWAEFVGDPFHWQAWGTLLHSIRTGEIAFRYVHGTDPWTLRARHPDASAVFDRAMTSLSRQVTLTVINAFDFGRYSLVVDVGGGHGAFLAMVLARHPQLRGVLFDQPHVVAGASALLGAAGVADRCEVVGGDFFASVPPGGDAYVMKQVLHDWEDADCLRLLRTCRQAMEPGAVLLIVERELGEPNERWEDKLSDLNMLAATGGRERTAEEYARLVERSGYRFTGTTSSQGGRAVFESVAV